MALVLRSEQLIDTSPTKGLYNPLIRSVSDGSQADTPRWVGNMNFTHRLRFCELQSGTALNPTYQGVALDLDDQIVLGGRATSGLSTGALLFSTTGYTVGQDDNGYYYEAQIDLNTDAMGPALLNATGNQLQCTVDVDIVGPGASEPPRFTYQFPVIILVPAYQGNESSPSSASPLYPGPQGPAGLSVLNGTGAPANTLGRDGEFYLDTAATMLYGPKTDGAWPGVGLLLIGAKGDPGDAGSTFATEIVAGVIKLATSDDVTGGTDDTKAVTPSKLKAAMDALVGGAPGALNTLKELADALGDDANFATTLTNALATKADAASAVTLTGAQTLTNKTLTSPAITTPTGIVKGDVGLGNVDNTSDASKPISTATQTALNLKQDAASAVTLTGAQTLTNKTLTSPAITTPTGIVKGDVGLGNVDNTSDADKPISSATQTALNLKQNAATAVQSALLGAANGVATLDSNSKLPLAQLPIQPIVYQGLWNASTNTPALASGVGTKGYLYKVSVAGATAVDGISQWNVGDSIVFDGATWDKIDGVASEVISVAGRVGAITLTSTDVGLGNVNNTSDANKPISTATQTALNLLAPIASPTFTGTVGGITATMVGLGNVANVAALPLTGGTLSGNVTFNGTENDAPNQVIPMANSGSLVTRDGMAREANYAPIRRCACLNFTSSGTGTTAAIYPTCGAIGTAWLNSGSTVGNYARAQWGAPWNGGQSIALPLNRPWELSTVINGSAVTNSFFAIKAGDAAVGDFSTRSVGVKFTSGTGGVLVIHDGSTAHTVAFTCNTVTTGAVVVLRWDGVSTLSLLIGSNNGTLQMVRPIAITSLTQAPGGTTTADSNISLINYATGTLGTQSYINIISITLCDL